MKALPRIIIILIFCIGNTLHAQLLQPARFELEQKALDNDFTLVSLNEEGIALFRETDKYKDGLHSWQLILLDTALNQKVDTLIKVERDYGIIGHEYIQGKFNLLFQVGEFAKNKLILCTVDLQTLELKLSEIKTELDIRLTHFSSIQNSVLFGGYISSEPAVVLYDVAKAKVQMVPGFLQRNTELLDLRVNENNTFNVVMVEKISGESKRIIFRTFDSQAKLLLEDIIESEENRSIQTAISSSLLNEDLLITGTWGIRNSNRSYGFYATLINPFEEQPLKLTAFGNLSHYLDYLKPRRVQKIKSKTKTALAAGKVYDFTNNVLPYKIIEHKEGYLILAETYSPVSFNNTSYYNSQNPQSNWNNSTYYNNPYYNTYPTSRLYRPISYSQNVANEEEIKTYSSTLLSLNAKGEIENDYSIKLDNIKIPAISQVTDANYYNGNAVLVYRKESKILYKKIIQLSDDVEEGEETIKLNDTFDEMRNERDKDAGIRHWHQDAFFTWGYQTIRNINLKDRTREVFYVNKVVIH